MLSWLPFVVKELSEDKAPILALAERAHVARAAVLDDRGRVLCGGLGSDELENAVCSQAMTLMPGQAASLDLGDARVLSERLGGPEALSFWSQAAKSQAEAWAAWLLTITRPGRGDCGPTVLRHVLAADGPFTRPRIPDLDGWSLLPLNAGLGRLIVLGDDELALETAALGARVGLKVTLGTVNPLDLDLRSAQTIGSFDLLDLPDWRVDPARLPAMGVRPGVMVLVTTPRNSSFLEALRASSIGWLGLAGEAAAAQPESGLFPEAASPAQRALGLIAAMLERRGL
jgi:hypothetical protein